MNEYSLNIRLKFTTECVRYRSAHFIAIWWVDKEGFVYTPNTLRRPYLFLVRKNLNNNYNLNQAKNFDLSLLLPNDIDERYRCLLHTQCDNHKLRIMVIPVCKIPNLSLYGDFEAAFINAPCTGTDEDYCIERIDNNAAYANSYNSFSDNFLMKVIGNVLTVGGPRGYGESIIDIDVVNKSIKNCAIKTFRIDGLITTGNPNNNYSICSGTLTGTNIVKDTFQLFPNPIDNGNPIPNYTFSAGMFFSLCSKSVLTDNIDNFDLNDYFQKTGNDFLQVPLQCCNTYERVEVSLSRSDSVVSNKIYVFYQEANPSSPNFLKFVNNTLRFNDINYSSSGVFFAIPGSLYIVYDDSVGGSYVAYQSSVSQTNVVFTLNDGTTLTVNRPYIDKINCN